MALTARAVALQVLVRVLDGNALDVAWAEVPADPKQLSDRDRSFARLMVLTTLRRLGQVDDVLRRCMEQPLQRGRGNIRDILRLGVTQLLFLDTPSHAAVDSTVELAGESPLKGLVNAVLRRLSREGKAMISANEAPRLNTPEWLWLQSVAAWGKDRARASMTVHLSEPPLDLTPRADAEQWAQKLGGTLLPTGTIRLRPAGAVSELAGYAEGAWWVQDAAAAIPARLLIAAVPPGGRVADLCAAPGGKTAQLCAAGLQVTAVDMSSERLKRLRTNLARLHLKADVVGAYAETWSPERPLDGVLLDAPCTATGTIRRHPEIPWIKTKTAAAELRPVQAALLEHAASMVRLNGTLVYSVCSLDKGEGEVHIADFLDRHSEFERVAVEPAEVGGLEELISHEGDLRTLPCHLAHIGGMDGFFASRLRRRAPSD